MADEPTFWNGEPCEARRVVVVIGEAPMSSWWCANLVGQKRNAVEIRYGEKRYYLDNEDGTGWQKVTRGRGSPWVGHRALPVASVEEVPDPVVLCLECGEPVLLEGETYRPGETVICDSCGQVQYVSHAGGTLHLRLPGEAPP